VASLDQRASSLDVRVGIAPQRFSTQSFPEYYQYPAKNAAVLTSPTSRLDIYQRFVNPFGGTSATVSQAAAIGSAHWASLSGSVPALLSQFLSAESYNQRNDVVTEWKDYGDTMYENKIFDNLAVCSQWPNPCGISDGRFVSGLYSDAFGLASSIGQYHREGYDPQRSTLKVIVTNNNYYTANNVKLRAYFATDFNSNVSPGGEYERHLGRI